MKHVFGLSKNKPKQSQFQSLHLWIPAKTNPNKANAGSLGNLFDHIEILALKTKLKILILRDRLDILPINEALRLIR